MHRLGYERYGAVGNDAGSMVSPEIGRLDTENVIGVHVTQLFSFPSGDPAELREPDRGGPGRARAPAVVLREQVLLQRAAQPAAAHPGVRAGRLADRPAGLERPAVRREPRRRLRPGQRGDLLADRHRRLGDPVLLRGRPRRRAAHRADHRPDRPGDVRGRLPVDPPVRRPRPHQHRQLERLRRRPARGRHRRTPAATTPRTRRPTCWSATSASSSPASADGPFRRFGRHLRGYLARRMSPKAHGRAARGTGTRGTGRSGW